MKQAEKQLKDAAKKLFADKKIDLLIGFEKGSLPRRARPVFIRSADDVEKLVWDETCSNNLTVYLAEMFRPRPTPRGQEPTPMPRIAIVVKGCDALSIGGLVREKQVIRQNLVVLGMPCTGITDPVTGEVVASCVECRHATPEGVDIVIAGECRKPAVETGRGKAIESRSAAERWAYFEKEISKCIRCYACRQACPDCYCRECFAEQTDPKWVGTSDDPSDTMFYQLGRLFHQAGRCVECGACMRACPMGVDLRAIARGLADDAKELYGFEPGEVMKETPLLCRFKDGDDNEFITDPEKQK